MSYGFGIVGLGLIADFHARAIQAMEKGRVVACLSRSEDKAKAFGEKYDCSGYTDMKDFLAHENLDIVTVCTPSGNHLEPGLEVIAAGKHLIVEKPMEITLKRCDTLIKTARKRGIRLSTVFPSRFNEVSQVNKKAVDAGRFGRLVLGDAYCKWYRSQAYYDDGGWKGTQALDGGGALMNQSIHAIDQLQWFMGPVKSVQAYSDILGHERINVEDAAVAVLEFACGAMGVIEGTTAVYPGWLKRIEINGTKGSMSMVEADLKTWEFEDEWEEDKAIRQKFTSKTDSGGGASDPAAISFEPHQWQFEEFIEALEAGRPSLAADDEGRKAVEIILAIYKSARTGKKVTLPL
jgi:predicted dehydrogenase